MTYERDTIARAAAALDDPGVTREAAPRAVDPLRAALADYDAAAEIEGCCGDGYCLVKRERGQHTNGGCRCPRDPWKAQRMMAHGQRLADAARAVLAAAPQPAPTVAVKPLQWVDRPDREALVKLIRDAVDPYVDVQFDARDCASDTADALIADGWHK